MRAWAANNSWSSNGADELAEIAAGVLAGKRFRTAGLRHFRSDIVEIWRESAARSAED